MDQSEQDCSVSRVNHPAIPQTNFLKSVPLLSQLPANILTKLGDVLETEQFCSGDFIIREQSGQFGSQFPDLQHITDASSLTHPLSYAFLA